MASTRIEDFNEFLLHNFVKPVQKCSIASLSELVDALKDDSLWYARVCVVQHAVEPTQSTTELKSKTLDYYKNNLSSPEECLEAARAAAVFEEPEALLAYVEKAQSLMRFEPREAGVRVKYSPHQTRERMRVSCLAASVSASVVEPADRTFLENVKVHSNEELFEPPQFLSEEEEKLSTSRLANLEYAVLLLRARYVALVNPSSSSIVQEQVLPYIRRISESSDFDQIDFSIRKAALYSRSVLEMKDIAELERGTVQLMKISRAVHSYDVDTDKCDPLRYFHILEPLPWRSVDELVARRLVAMSDFGNAVTYYRFLERPLDIAMCLTASEDTEGALKVLENPELADNADALLLRGDISSDPNQWQRAWDKFRVPKAKYRLAQRALADGDLRSALNHAQDALEREPTFYDALKLASSSALELKDWNSCVTHLRRQLAINEDDPSGWFNLATALLQLEQPQAAHHAIKQAIRVNQNSEPHLPTYTNYTALSAQLGLYEDVLVGLTRLAEAASRGSSEYIAKVTSVLPRFVANYTRQAYTGSTTQKQLVTLFSEQLPSSISKDDPMFARLTGQVELWAGRYQQGLAALDRGVELLVRSGPSEDSRYKARLQLYVRELADALEKHGDSAGRIEGSKAFPGWKLRRAAIEKYLH